MDDSFERLGVVVAASVANLSHHGPLYAPAACLRKVGAANAPFDLDPETEAHPDVAAKLLGAVFVAAQEEVARLVAVTRARVDC